jgi:signal transduction histidine kinase
MGQSVVGTIVPRLDSAGRDLEAMISDIVKNPERYRRNENENVRKNGERVWIAWSNQPLNDEEGRPRGILCVGMDMTERKKAEALLDAQAREQAAAAERTRLARDLHDAVSQTLFSASLIADVLPRIWERNPEQGRDRLEEIRQLTRGALAEMRTLLFELRPAALVDVELPDLLKQLAESVTGRARVPVSTHFEGQCRIPPDAKIALYRIAQEALNNIAKHSGADSGMVTLVSQPGRVELRVRDNGTGFDRSRVSGKSLGLGIMEERARAIGASLDVHSEVGRGTEVTAVWQISTEEEQP